LNIDKIKNKIKELYKYNLKIKVNIGRNKYEYYNGKIKDIYPNLFTVETNKGLKSWTYSDIATRTIVLMKFE
jgi:uncharacterized protein Veg